MSQKRNLESLAPLLKSPIAAIDTYIKLLSSVFPQSSKLLQILIHLSISLTKLESDADSIFVLNKTPIPHFISLATTCFNLSDFKYAIKNFNSALFYAELETNKIVSMIIQINIYFVYAQANLFDYKKVIDLIVSFIGLFSSSEYEDIFESVHGLISSGSRNIGDIQPNSSHISVFLKIVLNLAILVSNFDVSLSNSLSNLVLKLGDESLKKQCQDLLFVWSNSSANIISRLLSSIKQFHSLQSKNDKTGSSVQLEYIAKSMLEISLTINSLQEIEISDQRIFDSVETLCAFYDGIGDVNESLTTFFALETLKSGWRPRFCLDSGLADKFYEIGSRILSSCLNHYQEFGINQDAKFNALNSLSRKGNFILI